MRWAFYKYFIFQTKVETVEVKDGVAVLTLRNVDIVGSTVKVVPVNDVSDEPIEITSVDITACSEPGGKKQILLIAQFM